MVPANIKRENKNTVSLQREKLDGCKCWDVHIAIQNLSQGVRFGSRPDYSSLAVKNSVVIEPGSSMKLRSWCWRQQHYF